MRNSLFSFLFIVFACVSLDAQQPSKPESSVEKIMKSISHFQIREGNRDSTLRQPLGSVTEADAKRRFDFYDSIYTELNKLNTAELPIADLINLELIKYDVEDERSAFNFQAYLNPILSDEGFHTSLAAMGSQVLSTKKEFENYIERLNDIPRYVGQHLANMREGLRRGVSQPRAILNGYENTYNQHIVDDVERSVFWKPFLQKPFSLSVEDWTKLTADARTAIRNSAVVGFRQIKTFFDNEYLPMARTTIGVSHFPNGLAYYQDRVQHYTSTNMNYEEVYAIGLSEVARIKDAMMGILKEVKFKGTLKQFISSLRTNPKFYATTSVQLLKEASFIAKKADGMLPRFFGRLPRQPYGVEPVPAHLAPTYTAGRYSGAGLSSKRSGSYWVNTYDLKSRPLYALESLTLHEAVPGHHLQIALTKEMTELPNFRRNLYVNAFGEGWGLYCEFLGTEMGFYKDPYSHFGKLTYEMWRACRLVLDVALHTKGWTREQAVTYLAENTALSLHEVNTEINRYISWPGQALAYKIGELKIREFRQRAESKLKDKFDIRDFHDLVLSQGSVTLKILEEMVERFIEEKLK
ncbi:MAG: DUF885 domain-containing protein [Chitinophagaceae bacterium]|nr:DUF885 domain-containing protein [Chitinophagaceae bacterium]